MKKILEVQEESAFDWHGPYIIYVCYRSDFNLVAEEERYWHRKNGWWRRQRKGSDSGRKHSRFIMCTCSYLSRLECPCAWENTFTSNRKPHWCWSWTQLSLPTNHSIMASTLTTTTPTQHHSASDHWSGLSSLLLIFCQIFNG